MSAEKADFTDIYNQPDPREYYETLSELDYAIPTHGAAVFDVVIDGLRDDDASPTVLDLCCSYGVNAALVNHDVTLDEITGHYATASDMDRDELVAYDRSWYAGRRRDDPVDVLGLDVSQRAVDYAVEVGLLVDGVAADLEGSELTDRDAAKIADVDLVTVTGGIGYINDATFDQVLGAADETPWVAALSLRWIDFGPVGEALDAHGLVTEKLDDFVVPQRRFADADEERFVLDELAVQGVEPTDVEKAGHHGAELYVARPAGAGTDLSIADVFAHVAGGAVADEE